MKITKKIAEEYIGSKFGRWLVVGVSNRKDKNNRGVQVEVKCECGTSSCKPLYRLIGKQTLSCGCLQKDTCRKRPYEALFTVLKNSAQNGNHQLSLTFEEFVDFTHEKECHYCGGQILWHSHGLRNKGCCYNLDRKNNSIGYSKENCVVCCSTCNWAKAARYTYEEWKVMTEALRRLRHGNNTNFKSATA